MVLQCQVPHLAFSSEITYSLALLRPNFCNKGQERRMASFPTSCQFSYQGSPIYFLMHASFPSPMTLTLACTATGIHTL